MPESMPFIIKNGPGTQTLSGTIDPTSPSFINAGVLNLTGSFIGDINVNPLGTLTGSATITGTVTNDGTVLPTHTLTTTNFIQNIDVTYTPLVSATSTGYLVNA